MWQGTYPTNLCNTENLFWRCAGRRDWQDSCTLPQGQGCQRKKIAIAPMSSTSGAMSAAQEFFNFANALYPAVQSFSNGSYPYTYDVGAAFEYFLSKSDFDSKIDADSYGTDGGTIYSGAILVQTGAPAWEWTLRLNQTYFRYGQRQLNPQTGDGAIDDTIKQPADAPDQRGNSGPYNSQWANSGAMELGDLFGSFVSTSTCRC